MGGPGSGQGGGTGMAHTAHQGSQKLEEPPWEACDQEDKHSLIHSFVHSFIPQLFIPFRYALFVAVASVPRKGYSHEHNKVPALNELIF